MSSGRCSEGSGRTGSTSRCAWRRWGGSRSWIWGDDRRHARHARHARRGRPVGRYQRVDVEEWVDRAAGSRLEVRADGVREREQRDLGVLVVGDLEELGDLLLEEEVERGERGSESPRAGGEHEAPGGGEDRSVGAGEGDRGEPGRRRFDTASDAGDHERGNAVEDVGQVLHAVDHALLRVTHRGLIGVHTEGGEGVAGPVALPGLAVVAGDLGLPVIVGDDDEVPALLVRGRRGLHGEFDALADEGRLDGAFEVEAFADGSGGAQEFVGRQVEGRHCSRFHPRERWTSPVPSERRRDPICRAARWRSVANSRSAQPAAGD